MLAGARCFLQAATSIRGIRLLQTRLFENNLTRSSAHHMDKPDRLARSFARKAGSTKKNKEIISFEESLAAKEKNTLPDRLNERQQDKNLNSDNNIDMATISDISETRFDAKSLESGQTDLSKKSKKVGPPRPKKDSSTEGLDQISKPAIPTRISDIELSEDDTEPFYPEDEKAAARMRREKQRQVPQKPMKLLTIKATKESVDNSEQLSRLSAALSEGDSSLNVVDGKTLPKFDDGRQQGEWSDLPQITLKKDDVEKIDIEVEGTSMRVTKYLSRSGIASRRQAEKMIEEGLVRVNGKRALANVLVDPSQDKITIFTKKGEHFPMQEKTKIWSFYKPMGLICTHKDTHNRPTIFDYIKKMGLIKEDYFISVGRLDYNSEGLILLTNDGELARALELPLHRLERTYRVRVYGRFNDEKLAKIRKGAVINGVQYGPFYCEVDSYQTRNTWLMIKMHQGKNREIRRIMQKNDLRVNRLKRISYGPYKLGNLVSGQVREEPIVDEMKRLMYLATRKKLEIVEKEKLNQLEIKEEVVKKLEGRLLDPLPLLQKAKELNSSRETSSKALDGHSNNSLLL
jgi:23S rRNA pseudouridine2605 synthase